MKRYIMVLLIGLCLIGNPAISYASLDWQIRWDEVNSPQFAKVYIFNPENTNQAFSLEIGDIAKTSDPDPNAPQLIVGQDVSLSLAPGERKIFDIIVYQDIDPNKKFPPLGGKTYQLGSDSYKVLHQNYDTSSSDRQYPVQTRSINPVPKPQDEQKRFTYRNGRGYWTIALTDHDHVMEQVIRTGNRIGALHTSIQQAVLFYTLGEMMLTDEALNIWKTAFPELREVSGPQPPPTSGCTKFVTLISSNLSHYSASRTVMIGDVFGPRDPMLSQVVAAEDLTYTVPANTQESRRPLKVCFMSRQGQPNPQSEYVALITHNDEIERIIRIGQAENYRDLEIQDVIWYINDEVPAPTVGKGLWDRLAVTPTPKPSSGGGTCFGRPQTQPMRVWQSSSTSTTWKNLVVLVGAVVPFSMFFKRKNRK